MRCDQHLAYVSPSDSLYVLSNSQYFSAEVREKMGGSGQWFVVSDLFIITDNGEFAQFSKYVVAENEMHFLSLLIMFVG
jgi:hypothetical protein